MRSGGSMRQRAVMGLGKGGCAGRRAGGRAGGRACARVGAGAGARGFVGALRNGAAGEEDLHVDASAVVGERGQRAPLSGGANDQLVRGSDWIVPRSAVVRARVARGGHDQHLRFVKMRCVSATSHSSQLAPGRLEGSSWLPRAALRRGALRQGRPSQDVASSFVEHAARVRFEQRGVFDEVAARQRALHDLQTSSGW